ncbi:MinD-like ATPase involved in chromosome partitioning or flagellar assembly [Nocardiopsis mwathae]|uniref:MinD-like ATPase involved in chromosome partitioning or flagellar assembly n=1 Tax=Nocardiopsis mwathae TaxID=1472723 RepID=A0A7W9YKH1_9ACTN|nr:hypothetical protein [Nocardiopsis mwathae]MBB6173858.1 MinD-like ATPase involved in chromosome partitioning or flagellar assembly [Nocardiopsis mwathae]
MNERTEPPGAGAMTAGGRHGDSLLRRVGRGVLVPFQPSDRALSAIELGGALQQTITTSRRIVVSRPRAGAGESTVTALLATVFAHYRNDRVLTMDITPGSDALARRLGVRPESSLGDLERGEADPDSFDELAPYLTAVRDRLWMLPGVQNGRRDGVDGQAFHRTLLPLTRFFGITLIDRGADVFDGFNRAAQASAHAHVLVAPATREGAVSIARAFDWMTANGNAALPADIVVVFVEQAPGEDPTFDAAGAADILRRSGAAVVRLGYDRHLAATSAFDPRRIAAATRTAAARIALEALRRAL